MERQELYQRIELQPEIVQKLEQVEAHLDLEKIDTQLDKMTHMETAAEAHKYLDNYFQNDPDKIKMLFCQLEGARRIYTKYREMNIPNKIFIETMKCFTRFIDECGKKNGRLFFDRDWWVYRQLSINIFRIGALEYQFAEYKGENVISIHIPSDADCSKQSLEILWRWQRYFFRLFIQVINIRNMSTTPGYCRQL